MKETLQNSYFEHQIEKYLSQVIRAFSIFYVSDGVERDGAFRKEKVPVIFGSPSRVVAAMLSNSEKFRNIKVPIMGVHLSGIEIDEESKLNPYHEYEISFRPSADGESRNVRRKAGVALRLNVDLNIYASSVSQLMEIFEQIALVYNPEVRIQKSADPHDVNYITSVRLEGITPEISNPLGQNSRATEMSLQFSVPITLSYPPQIDEVLDEIRLLVTDKRSNETYSDDIIALNDEELDEIIQIDDGVPPS